MNSPESAAPSPKKKTNALMIGCLVLVAGAVVLAIAVVVFGVILAKREESARTPAQRQAEKQASNKQWKEEEAARLAPTLAQGQTIQARLAKIAGELPAVADMKAMPCPHVAGESLDFVPIDAELLRRFRDGIPRDDSGTAWFRHAVFAEIVAVPKSSYPGPENEALALIAADKIFADSGHIAVIHTSSLKAPHLLKAAGIMSDGSFDAGHFSGWIQLIAYPDDKTVCEVPFSADSSQRIGGGIEIGLRIRGISIPVTGALPKPAAEQQLDDDFQSNVWTAAEAAIAK